MAVLASLARADQKRTASLLSFFESFGIDIATRWKTGWGERYIVTIAHSIEWEVEGDNGEFEPAKERAEFDFRELLKLAEGLGYQEDFSSFYANL